MNDDDLISRKALKKVIETYRPIKAFDDFSAGKTNMVNYCLDEIDNAPTVVAENATSDRPKGEWVFKHNSSDIWCSVCDENFDEIPQKFNYCPNCGADMRGDEE